jgi:transcriptional regulator GlxA family with amidase domain
MHSIAVLALPGVVPFDLATPCEVFSHVPLPDGSQAYDVRVCGLARHVKAKGYDLRVAWRLDQLARADTIVVPGLSDPLAPVPPAVRRALVAAAARGARVVSICTGAFVLAAAGLLDGLRATTHWLAAAEFARRYPQVDVDPDVLFVDNGRVFTSAGAAAGLDLCLHLVRLDHGAAVAADAARLSVMPLQREGGQAQFIVHTSPPASPSLDPLLAWLTQHPARSPTLTEMAHRAGMSPRTFSRRFLDQTGETPVQWLLGARVRHAQRLLETSSQSVEQVASACGFGSASAFRARFTRVVGTAPARYRRAFQRVGQA